MTSAATEIDVGSLPARIETLLDELDGLGNQAISGRAEELVAAVAALYGAGLERLVGLMAVRPDGAQLVRAMCGDELVANLLMLHGLHPDDVGTRIQGALDRVRPYLGSHAGGIEFLGVDADGVARLRLEGSCDGCAGSAATVHTAVEKAVLDAAPEVSSVHVEGMVEPAPAPPGGLLQIGRRCPDGMAEAASA
ncbi:MAG: NifU family protein [Jatrophihabitantaceae bacterium]